MELLAVGAQLLYFRALLAVELRFGQRRIDGLHLVRAVVGEGGSGEKAANGKKGEAFHGVPPLWTLM
jgi:hypothetical protein